MPEAADDPQTGQVIGAAIEVHKHLGPGLLESVYEEALCYEFELRRIPYERQKGADVVYKDKIIKGQELDLVAFGEVVVELKAVPGRSMTSWRNSSPS
jgi:GxxExxY protein